MRRPCRERTAIYQQIRNAVVRAIADGQLQPGERLPTVRALAQEAGINSMTVNKAYQLLKQEGYITTDGRNGAAVGSGPGRAAAASTRRQKLEEELKLIVAEAKVNGISLGELEQMIGKLY